MGCTPWPCQYTGTFMTCSSFWTKLADGRIKPGTIHVSSIIFWAKHELTSKAVSKSVFLTVFWTLKTIKLQTLFQKDTKSCKEATISPVWAISGQVAIFLSGGAGNSDHLSSNNNMLIYVIRREQRLALKHRSLKNVSGLNRPFVRWNLHKKWHMVQTSAQIRSKTIIAGFHEGSGGLFTRAAVLSALLNASTSANPAAQCRYESTPHALSFQAAQAQWPIRAAILFTWIRFALPLFRSRANLVEWQLCYFFSVR